MWICGLYEEIRNLPGFLFTRMEEHLIGRSWSYKIYVISLERYYHDEFSAAEITEIGSVEVEKRSNYGGMVNAGGRQERGVCAPRLTSQHPQGRLTSGMDGVESLRDEGIIPVIIHQ